MMKKEYFGREMLKMIGQDMEARQEKIEEMSKEKLNQIRRDFQ